MGHCAKYGAYTIFCCTVPMIIHFALIQVRNLKCKLQNIWQAAPEQITIRLLTHSLSQEVTHSRMPTCRHPLYQSINQSINQTINPLFSIITVCLPIYTGHKVYLCKCIISIYHQRNQAGSSPAMEFMGFKACMDYLTGCGLLPKAFVSDRHVSIAAYMRKSLPNITHYFDIWHLKKSK